MTFQELQKVNSSKSRKLDKKGYKKIKDCCKLAASENWQYTWIDTCCIDKTSSAELSEAIKSMYRWYEKAQVCYAYLADVDSAGQDEWSLMRGMEQSRWFTRGWTLQELLAPNRVVFYDKTWVEIGSKSSLSEKISAITRIKHEHLISPLKASVAAKMSWASKRTTFRIEDIAYSLMGLFEVNMPLLYGEGRKAFTRLQHEIVKISDDESIFAWRDDGVIQSGAFARSPVAFLYSGDVVNVKFPHLERPPYTVTHRGLAIEATLRTHETTNEYGDDVFFIALQCAFAMDLAKPISIELVKFNQHDLIRTSVHRFDEVPYREREVCHNKLVYIRPIDNCHQAPTFHITMPSQYAQGFSISETYQCQPQLCHWDKARREECWKIEVGLQDNLAALLFKNDRSNGQEAFAVILIASQNTPQMEFLVPTKSKTLTEIVENNTLQLDQYKDTFSCRLHSDLKLWATSRRRDAGCFVEINMWRDENGYFSGGLIKGERRWMVYTNRCPS